MPVYNLIDFMPECMLPSCPDIIAGQVHRHILPKQQAIFDSSADYLYCQGGVGSAKSVAFAAKAVYLSLTVPNNKGVVSRYHYDDLYDSSWRDVKACIARLVDQRIIPEPAYSKKVQGDYTEITFFNGSEMKAIQGKNWHRGLGASHGWFWVDDAMECSEDFFIGNDTSAGLLSRLRLPGAHYFKDVNGVVSNKLHGMISSNPPPIGHWLHKLFGVKPGLHKLGEQTIEWIQIATHENPFVGADYAIGLMAIQAKMGRSQNVAKRVIFGESVPAYGGVKVFPQFDHAKHVGSFKFDPAVPLIAGWDFGFHHPAIVFSHLLKCDYNTNHYISLSEIADAFSLTVYKLYDEFVKPHIKERYKDACIILHAGDKAGYRVSSSNRDRRGDMKILIDEYSIPFKHRALDLRNSLQYMRGLLEPKKPCECGREIICIDQLGCPVLIGALEGGYKYSKNREGKIGEKPVEDRYFADIACAWRYGAENFVKWGVPHEDRESLHRRPRLVSPFGGKPWGWMDMDDTAMGKMLTH